MHTGVSSSWVVWHVFLERYTCVFMESSPEFLIHFLKIYRKYRLVQEGAGGRTMAANPNSSVQEAVDAAISEGGEIGLQVAAYVDGTQVVDVWGGLADV